MLEKYAKLHFANTEKNMPNFISLSQSQYIKKLLISQQTAKYEEMFVFKYSDQNADFTTSYLR